MQRINTITFDHENLFLLFKKKQPFITYASVSLDSDDMQDDRQVLELLLAFYSECVAA